LIGEERTLARHDTSVAGLGRLRVEHSVRLGLNLPPCDLGLLQFDLLLPVGSTLRRFDLGGSALGLHVRTSTGRNGGDGCGDDDCGSCHALVFSSISFARVKRAEVFFYGLLHLYCFATQLLRLRDESASLCATVGDRSFKLADQHDHLVSF